MCLPSLEQCSCEAKKIIMAEDRRAAQQSVLTKVNSVLATAGLNDTVWSVRDCDSTLFVLMYKKIVGKVHDSGTSPKSSLGSDPALTPLHSSPAPCAPYSFPGLRPSRLRPRSTQRTLAS